MSPLTHRISIAAPLPRSLAIAALLGTTFLVSPIIAARADSVIHAPIQLVQADKTQAAADTAATKEQTLDQRIDSLHASLKITPNEETKWNDVAQAMRDNAAAMQKLAAEKSAQSSQSMTAVDDLNTYQKFAQAHVDGLKNLTASFQTLYDSMPDAQKKIADQVFQDREAARSHG
jgi:hypothetical protein